MNRRQKIIVSVVGIFIVLLALVGITYGYFLTRIQGNTNTTSITVTTANLKLVYGDGNNIITGTNIEPGWTTNGLNGNPEAKTFTIKNEGNATVENFNIYLEDVKNTLSRKGDLIYTIECENTTVGATSTECEDFEVVENEVNSEGELVFPSVMSIIAKDTLDPKTATTNAEEHTYTITVTYKEAGIDQSEDMGKEFRAKVNIYDAKFEETNKFYYAELTPIQGKFLSDFAGVPDDYADPSIGGYFDYIPVNGDNYIKYTTFIDTSMSGGTVGFIYDEKYKVIGRLDRASKPMAETIMLMPSKAKYIRLNYAGTDTSKYYVIVENITNAPVLKYSHSLNSSPIDLGDKVVALGDSVIFGTSSSSTGLYYEYSNYMSLLKTKASISTLDNKAISGTYICDNENSNSIYNTVINLSGDYDSIIVAGGVNDFAFGKTLGKLTDTDPTTFYGALNSMCEYLKLNYSSSNIIFITPIVDDCSTNNALYSNANPYRNAIYEVATQYNFNVIDGTKLGIEVGDTELAYDGCHLTKEGHVVVAEKLSELLK